jgi:16S rRNA (uracil1498-N3)-methyltransferase
MQDFRAFWVPTTGEFTEISLPPSESHHLVVVNRAHTGDTVVVFDGRGTEWECELLAAKKAGAMLRVRSARKFPALPYKITLAQALPKGGTMDSIIRKATELGATCIVPLETERTQVHLGSDRSERKIEKWQTTALEAAKQCGNPFLPEIAHIQPITTFLDSFRDTDLKLIASLQPGARSLKPVLAAFQHLNARKPKTVAWLVGPEGDFTPKEMSQALAAGFEPITMGPLVLRCETAAIYALSVLSYELQGD